MTKDKNLNLAGADALGEQKAEVAINNDASKNDASGHDPETRNISLQRSQEWRRKSGAPVRQDKPNPRRKISKK